MAKRRSTTEAKEKDASGSRKTVKPSGILKSTGQDEGAQHRPGGGLNEATTATPEPGLSIVEFNARVARKAYDLFERRGRQEGHDVEDWLEAERLVREELLQQGEAVTS